jgi:hypothetical protein
MGSSPFIDKKFAIRRKLFKVWYGLYLSEKEVAAGDLMIRWAKEVDNLAATIASISQLQG